VQSLNNQDPIDVLRQVWRLQEWSRDQPTPRIVRSLCSRAPYVASNGHPGIGREGCTTSWIVPHDRSPETDTPSLQGFLVAQRATSYTPNDGVHQAVVTTNHLLDVTCFLGTRLALHRVAKLRRRPMQSILSHEIPPFAE
jgi:hypothetical protein